TFRNPETHRENNASQPSSDEESEPPAALGIDHRGIEQCERAERAQGRANPEAAVDDQVAPAAHTGGDQLLNRRVDRGIFAADAGSGDKAKEREAEEAPGKSGRSRRREIDRQRDEEQLLAPQPVGEPAKSNR